MNNIPLYVEPSENFTAKDIQRPAPIQQKPDLSAESITARAATDGCTEEEAATALRMEYLRWFVTRDPVREWKREARRDAAVVAKKREWQLSEHGRRKRREWARLPEQVAKRRARYERLKNCPVERAKIRNWHNEKYRKSPEFALALRVRCRIRGWLLKGGIKKECRTEALVGCNFKFLREYIEKQFSRGMSWDRPDSFHLDHIVPLSSFELTDPEQLRVACNWQNLRPMRPISNLRKGGRVTEPQLHLPLSVTSEKNSI
jgi:hypothetical protein